MSAPTGSRVEIRDLERAESPLQALAEAAVEINAAGSVEELLSAVARGARLIVGARMCSAIVLGDGPAPGTTLAASLAGEYAPWSGYAGRPDGSGVYSSALRSRAPLRLTHEELLAHPAWHGFRAAPGAHPPVRGLLVVPMLTREREPLGVIQLSDAGGRDFDEDDETLMIPLAQIASAAVERQLREDDAGRVRRDLAEAQRIAHLGSWVYEVEEDRVVCSDETCRIVGLDPLTFSGRMTELLARVHPEDLRDTETRLAASLWERRPFRTEVRMVRPDGEVRTVLSRAEIESDEHGWPKRMIGTVLDVTGRRRVEDELRERNERVAALAAERRRLISETLASEERARERIADVLHDGVLQDLLVARQDIREVLDQGEPAGAALLERAETELAEAVAGLREAVGELHPLTLTHGGLQTALEAVARSAARRAGFAVTVKVGAGAAGPRDSLMLALGREFLANAEKHARARTVALGVERIHGLLRLTVTDDGVGMAPEAASFRVGHLGLPAARERVEVLGGALTIAPRPGGGTRVSAVVPAGA